MSSLQSKVPNHRHEWRGSWNRPIKIDEDDFDAFTIARMTDHNVRGLDAETISEPTQARRPLQSAEFSDCWESEGGSTLLYSLPQD